jgi:hypothetical protein
MWMGGVPPLGYDVRERRLVVNPAEAKTVRYIIAVRYVERLSRLSFTAPESSKRSARDVSPLILVPRRCSTETLLNRLDLPLEWSAQLNALAIE